MNENHIHYLGKSIILFVASISVQQVSEQASLIKDIFAGVAQFLIAFTTLYTFIKTLKSKKK